MEDGIKRDDVDKNFTESENKVYLYESMSTCEDNFVNLFAKALADRYKTKEEVVTTSVKFVILEVDMDNLENNLLSIDKYLEPLKDNEYIQSFVYNGDIPSESIKFIPQVYEQTYLKEEILEYL